MAALLRAPKGGANFAGLISPAHDHAGEPAGELPETHEETVVLPHELQPTELAPALDRALELLPAPELRHAAVDTEVVQPMRVHELGRNQPRPAATSARAHRASNETVHDSSSVNCEIAVFFRCSTP